jgi:hypothetical protein
MREGSCCWASPRGCQHHPRTSSDAKFKGFILNITFFKEIAKLTTTINNILLNVDAKLDS